MTHSFQIWWYNMMVSLVTLVTLITLVTLVTLITLVTLATLITLVTLITLITLVSGHSGHPGYPGYPALVSQSVYRAECITVTGFFASDSILMLHIGLQLLSCCRCVCICLCLLAPFPWGIRIPVSQRLFFWISRIETNKCRASLWPISPQNIFQII